MKGEVDVLDGDKPRYQQLSAVLQSRIETGVYPVGSLLPTEIELCDEFVVSRYTVREALRKLTDAGFLRRRQGSGSQVMATKPHENYVQSLRSLSELTQYAADTRLHVTKAVVAKPDPQYATDLGDGAKKSWLTVEGVRKDHTGEMPICWSVVFINADFRSVVDELAGHSGAIYTLIEQRFNVVVGDVYQEIRTQPMPPVAVKALKTSSRVWSLRVVRRYMGADGKLLLTSVNYHPGDRFTYSSHLKRDSLRGRA